MLRCFSARFMCNWITSPGLALPASCRAFESACTPNTFALRGKSTVLLEYTCIPRKGMPFKQCVCACHVPPCKPALGFQSAALSADRATASPRVNQPSITVGRCPVGSCDMLGVPMAALRLPAVVGSVFVSVVLLVASSSSMHASIMHTQAPGSVKFRRKVSGNANAV